VNILQDLELALHKVLGSPPQVKSEQLSAIAELLNYDTTAKIVDHLLQDPTALALIANRSYTHSLGFRKITLIDIDQGYTLRLHIWDSDSQPDIPLVEAKHEHSFDFISRVLYGGMETQCYKISALTDAQKTLLATVKERLAALDQEQRKAVSAAVASLETAGLTAFGSHQAQDEGLNDVLESAAKNVRGLLQLSADELATIVDIQGQYQYDKAKSIFGGRYMHSHVADIMLAPCAVIKLVPGDIYFHGHEYAHRLYMPANQPNATLVVTTQVSADALGSNFQHPSWFAGEEVGFARSMYTADNLSAALRAFKDRLQQTASISGRQVVVK